MKEIGGYFELEKLISNEYYKNLIALNNGRSALLYIIRAKKIKKLYIPYYLCDSVIDILRRENYEFEYYPINQELLPIFNKKLSNDEYIYIVNYYGQLENQKIISLKNKFKNMIMDYTHAFFQKPVGNIDTIYTCRKFFGVPDGAYLSTDARLSEDLDTDISKDRMKHVLGRFEGRASDYYNDFQSNDKSFKGEPLKYMSKLTHNIIGAIDYEKVFKSRNENYAYLHNKLCKYNKLKLIIPDGVFAYPFYIENGIEIRKELAKRKIYIPTLWPNVLEDMPEDSIEFNYASNILSLPCDQRYGTEDMEYITEEIKKCIN